MESSISLPGPKEHAAWLINRRRQLQKLLGGPEQEPPLHGAIVGRSPEPAMAGRPAILIEQVTYEGEFGEQIPATMLIPRDKPLPLPAIICLHSQSDNLDAGRTEVVGPQGIATELCGRGYVVLAPEVPGYADRRDLALDVEAGRLLLQGWSLPAKLVWEVSRAIEYLALRPEVEDARLGLLALGKGGITGWLSAAVQVRLSTTVICWGAGTYASILRHGISLGPTGWPPGLLNWGDIPEVCTLIAPRPLFFCASSEDPNFPNDGFEELYWRVRQFYLRLGEGDKLDYYLAPGPPQFDRENRARIANWFDKWV